MTIGLQTGRRTVFANRSSYRSSCVNALLGSGTCPFIDHFCVSDSLANRIVRSFIMDSGENLSDHMPLCLRLSLNFPIRAVRNVSTPLPKSLRWDKADLIWYYYGTYNYVSQIFIDGDAQRCEIGCSNCIGHIQDIVDGLYSTIINALLCNSNSFVPRARAGFTSLGGMIHYQI